MLLKISCEAAAAIQSKTAAAALVGVAEAAVEAAAPLLP